MFGTLGRVVGAFKGLYSGINGATLTGAIDVVVVEQKDGSFKCSPFHVRFGKLGVLRSREKVVDIEINGVPAPVRMKLGETGEAFFVEELDVEDDLDDDYLATSPLPTARFLGSDDLMSSHGSQMQPDDNLSSDEKFKADVSIHVASDDIKESEAVDAADEEVVEITSSTSIKQEDSKGKKKRRRRRKNQGQSSRCDMRDEQGTEPQTVHDVTDSEAIFQMDEDEDMPTVTASTQTSGPDADDSINSGIPKSRSFHQRDFFSDTEVDAAGSPQNSRPGTPIQSDSEYEISKVNTSNDQEVGKWPWGELPSKKSTPAATPLGPPSAIDIQIAGSHAKTEEEANKDKAAAASKTGFLSRLFYKSGKDQTDEISGKYLDELNFETMDPATAALYFPNNRDREIADPMHFKQEKDEDGESGKGNSLPQSPAPGSSPKSSHISIHMEESKRNSDFRRPVFEGLSRCGNAHELFDQSILTYDELAENPDILLQSEPESLVAKIDGKLVPWSAALPQLLSTIAFQRPLPSHVYEKLIEQNVKKEDDRGISRSNSTSVREKKAPSSWLPWRRYASQEDVGPDSTQGEGENNNLTTTTVPSSGSSPGKTEQETTSKPKEGETNHVSVPIATSSDESEYGVRDDKNSTYNSSNDFDNSNSASEKFKKTLRLTSDQIATLGLCYGRNEAVFSVTTAYQGTTVARCHIYLWKYDDKIVVSDIDGTITKSDVLGHILPIIGKDWAQSGVAQLFTQIQANGYKMLYLSARAIGQAAATRDYLKSVKQGDITLPDGPLLLNPTSLLSAFHREVIEKKPEEFKIACLKDIQTLFPENPFYAGYGNRINDVWSYRAVDINISRIFTINHKGELRHALTNTFQSSYTSLVELAEHIFPVYNTKNAHRQIDGYSTFEFWRDPLPMIEELNTPEEMALEYKRRHSSGL